jgi:hypothetical protein
MKPFDEKFADNVREVFDTWHEPVDEQAWLDMKNRLKKSEKKTFLLLMPVFIKYAAAAVVLIVASATLWLLLLPSGVQENQMSLNEDASPPAVISAEMNQHQINTNTLTPAKSSIQAEPILVDENPGRSEQTKSNTNPLEETNQNKVIASVDSKENKSLSSIPKTQENLLDVSAIHDTIVDEIIIESHNNIELAESQLAPVNTTPDDAQIIAFNLAMMENQEKKSPSKPGVEFFAGSMKTYSNAEIAGGMGYSAGITGNWPLSDRFSIGGGGVLVFNQFSLNEPIAAVRSDKELLYSPNIELSGDYSDYNIVDQKVYADMNYVAIDIPVNLRYRISNISKGKLYVSAGLSSVLYLQQNYTKSSDVTAVYSRTDQFGNAFPDSEKALVSTSTEFEAFRHLDLGRLLNFSVGYMINRDKNSLLIEPFIKYPLGDITSMNLQIGMAGISLRYNFARP